MANTNTRQTNRTPVTLKIKFKSETLDQFIERYAVDISQGGIFIRTKAPLPVGTPLKFEFLLKDASLLIAGDGTVVWTREHDPSRTGVSPGMGVRFDKLPSESQATLGKVLRKKSSGHANSSVLEAIDDDEDDAAGDFVDSPTRVAPAGLVDSLTNSEYDDDDITPLPQPVPFHSKDDDFDEDAFSESTRVASVDSVFAEANDIGNPFADVDLPAKPQIEKPDDDDEYEDPFGDLNESAPLGPAEKKTAEKKTAEKKTEKPKTVTTVAATPVREDSSSGMPWIAVAAFILFVGGVGGFWLLNKDKNKNSPKKENVVTKVQEPLPTAAIKDPIKTPADAAPKVPAVPTRSVAIAVTPADAMLSVQGTDLSSGSPASFSLEEGKHFRVEIRHDKFLATTIDIVADGSEIPDVVLLPKPKVIQFASVPPGAVVMINGVRLKKTTPVEMPLTKRLKRQTKARIQIRLPGHKSVQAVLNLEEGWEARDAALVKLYSATLVSSAPPPRPQNPRKPPVKTDTPKTDTPKTDTPKTDTPKPSADEGKEPTPDWLK